MEWNHCSHLGILINKILAHFDPEVILLLKSKFPLKATKGLGREGRKLVFKMADVAAIVDFLLAHLAILCLSGALMLIIKF